MTMLIRRTSPCGLVCAALVATMCLLVIAESGKAAVVQFFGENFDSLPLGPFVSPTEGGGDGTDFTNTPPAGWTRDNTTTPIGSPIEFQGWSFIDKQSWINTAGNQDRASFVNGLGTVMVADPDEYDDGTNIDPNLMRTFITTPTTSLSGVVPNSMTLAFDSSFRPFDTMTGLVDVSFDGGATWTNLETLNTANSGGNSSLSRVNEQVAINVANPASADVKFRFGMTDAGNDWWWAVDNISASVDNPAVVTLLSENFDGLPLQPFVAEGGGDGTDFTQTPPAGWTRDNSQLPPGNTPEFEGWTFLDKQSWINAAGNQDRDQFTRGMGTVMVADPDEYDDFTNVDPDQFNAFITTPAIDLSGIATNSLELEFDSSFRPFDGQTGRVEVSFDGGNSFQELLLLNTLNSGGNSSLGRVNEHISLSLNNPSGGTAILQWSLTNAGNDWWWAVDNIQVTGAAAVPEPTTAALGLCVLGAWAMRRRRRPT